MGFSERFLVALRITPVLSWIIWRVGWRMGYDQLRDRLLLTVMPVFSSASA